MVSVDRDMLVAFGVVGAVWVLGVAVVFLGDPVAVSIAALFVVVFAPTLATRGVRTGVALLAAWTVAVLAMGAAIYGPDSLIGELIFLGGLSGTFAFCAWVLPSFVLLLLLDPHRTTFKV